MAKITFKITTLYKAAIILLFLLMVLLWYFGDHEINRCVDFYQEYIRTNCSFIAKI